MRRRGTPRRDGHVAEEAESHRARRLRVVTGRPERAHAEVRLPSEQRIHERAGAAGGVHRRLERAGNGWWSKCLYVGSK